jgi:SOS-response transcriptional repressor LexA
MTETLPRRQELVVLALHEHLASAGRHATVRWLCGRCGWRSTNAAHCHLLALARKGWVLHHSCGAGAWRLAHCGLLLLCGRAASSTTPRRAGPASCASWPAQARPPRQAAGISRRRRSGGKSSSDPPFLASS